MSVALGQVWFRLYMFKDRELTPRWSNAQKPPACKAIVWTVDVPALGKRERDVRNRFALPDHLCAKNLLAARAQEAPKLRATLSRP